MLAATLPSAKLRKVNQLVGVDAVWRPLARAKHSNELWTTVVDGRQLVLRVNAAQQLAFGVSRQMEQLVLSAISGYDWAPEILNCDPLEGWCLMGFHGTSLADLQINNPLSGAKQRVLSSQLVQAVTDMHSIDLGPVTDYGELLKLYHHHFCGADLSYPEEVWRSRLDELTSLLTAFNEQPKCLVHHDLHAGNICWLEDQQRLVIIDWEYAGIGIPWLDLAQLLSSGLLSKDQLRQLPLWQHCSPEKVACHLASAGRANDLLARLWLLARE